MNITRYPLEKAEACFPEQIDVFICASSYEDRCSSLATHIDPSKITRAFVVENKNLLAHVGGNGKRLRDYFGGKATDVAIDTTNPIETADSLSNMLQQAFRPEQHTYLIDITTFTHESLLILAQLLRRQAKPRDVVRFAYTSAADYSVGDRDTDKWLSKGVGTIRSVLGYPGEVLPSRQTHLIVLVGYEHERASELIKAYEPAVISLGHGRAGTATSEKHHNANRHFHGLALKVAATYGAIRTFTFPCNNPVETQRSIEEELRAVPDHNAVAAPMNTKISALGAALAAIRDETIQLCYAEANLYNYKRYSSPGSEFYLLELPELFAEIPRLDIGDNEQEFRCHTP